MRSRGFTLTAVLEARVGLAQWDLLETDLVRASQHAEGSAGLRIAMDRVAGLRWSAVGDLGLAEKHLRRSLAIARHHGMSFDAAQAQEALSRVVSEEEGAALRDAAQETYRQLGVPFAERVR